MSASAYLDITYYCGSCDLPDQSVTVRVRKDNEDVVEYVDAVVAHCMSDHKGKRPFCDATTFQRLEIPIDGRSRVGGPAELH